MRSVIGYLLHYTWLRNKKTAFNCLRFTPFLISTLLFILNNYFIINLLVVIMSIILFIVISFNKRSLYKNFHYVKYINCSKRVFKWLPEGEKEIFYRTIIKAIKDRDISFNKKKYLKFKKLDNLEFKNQIVSDLSFETFVEIIEELKNNTWIRDVFSYKKVFIQFMAILDSQLNIYSKKIELINSKEISKVFNDNIQITSSKIDLNQTKLKKELGRIIKCSDLKHKKLNTKQRNHLFNLFKNWFNNSDEEIYKIIDLNTESLKNSELICNTPNKEFNFLLLFLINEKIYDIIKVKKFINTIKIKSYSSNNLFKPDNFPKHKNQYSDNWNQKENNFISLIEKRNKNRKTTQQFVNHFYSSKTP